MQGKPRMQNQQPKVESACPQRSEDSRLQASGAASERLDSDQQDQHVSPTEVKDSRFSDQHLCDWYEAQPETYLNYLYENFGANTPREAWAAHMNGKRTLRCACCDSTNLEQFCHLAPDPIFMCLKCGTSLNVDGSVCVAHSRADDAAYLAQYQRWLAERTNAAFEKLENLPEITSEDLALQHEGCRVEISQLGVAAGILMQFMAEQDA